MELKQHLSHPEIAVKTFILKELKRTAEVKPQILLTNFDLLVNVIEQISNDDLGVAKLAMEVIKIIGCTANGTKALYSGILLRTIAKLLAQNNEVSFRLYEVIIYIAKSSEQGLEASANSGLLSSLINILDNDDILLQLNALETVSELATSDSGLKYLEDREILSELNKKIAKAHDNPLSSLLIPGLMKFFGCVAKNHPYEIFSKYPLVISALFEIIEETEDMILLEHALDTLGFVASTVDGKYALDNLGGAMLLTIKKIRNIIRDKPTELRLRALDNLALILHVEKIKQNNRVLVLTKSWFDLLDDNPLSVIVDLCKQPFPDIRQSSMKVLLELATQPWGQEYIINCPGLLEFLVNRSAESIKECKELKYGIIKNLKNSEYFDSRTMQQLEKFVKEGPFYVDADVEVATESGGNS